MYAKVPSQELKLNYGDGTALHVRFRGFEDTVVWNPSEELGKDISDMEDKGWVSFGSSLKTRAVSLSDRKSTSVSSPDTFESSRRSSREKSSWVNKSCELIEPARRVWRGRKCRRTNCMVCIKGEAQTASPIYCGKD